MNELCLIKTPLGRNPLLYFMIGMIDFIITVLTDIRVILFMPSQNLLRGMNRGRVGL